MGVQEKEKSRWKGLTYKARVVAKGYSKKSGFDYEETFSPVDMIKSIRILLSIVAYYDFEIWKPVSTPSLESQEVGVG